MLRSTSVTLPYSYVRACVQLSTNTLLGSAVHGLPVEIRSSSKPSAEIPCVAFQRAGTQTPRAAQKLKKRSGQGSAKFLANENASSRCDVGHAGGRDVLKMRVALLDRMETNREEQV